MKKIAKEEDKLNEYTNKWQIEDLYRSFKSDNSPPSLGRKCDRTEMRACFRKPFTAAEHENDHIELHRSITP